MAFLKFNKAELVNLSYSLRREIIAANKTGAYCNTSIVTCNTRRYHGLLAVPVDNFGGGQYMLLSSLDETLSVWGKDFNLGIHCYGDKYDPRGHKYIVDFDADPVPKITYKVGEILFTKTILLVPDNDQVLIRFDLLKAPSAVTLKLRPFLAFRNVHDLTHENSEARLAYDDIPGGVTFNMYKGFPDLNLQLSGKHVFKDAGYWYKGVTYSDEYRRGYDCMEDLYAPGYFETTLKQGDSVVFSASVNEADPVQLKRKFTNYLKKRGPITSFYDQLVHCADVLTNVRQGKKTINAGLSWLYTGLLRETAIALPGLTLFAGGKVKEFEEILDNLIECNQERLRTRTTQVEAPLRLTPAIQKYIKFTGDSQRAWNKWGETLKTIVRSYAPGIRKEVAMHPNGLLWAQMDGVALSWMNTYINGKPVNERAGYQIETNAFWYNAICFALEMERKYAGAESDFVREWEPIKTLIEANFTKTFWNDEVGYLADYVDNKGQNLQLRSNLLWAICLTYSPVSDEIKSAVMRIVDRELVTARGIRSLSPRDNDYKGVYEGSQSDRDFAYHNGCARPSLLTPYVRMKFEMNGSAFWKKAEWLVEGFYEDLSMHGVGAFSELYDGDPPHYPHGAISSALSTAALLEINYLLTIYKEK